MTRARLRRGDSFLTHILKRRFKSLQEPDPALKKKMKVITSASLLAREKCLVSLGAEKNMLSRRLSQAG